LPGIKTEIHIELHQDPQMFIAGEFLGEIAVHFSASERPRKFLCRLFHNPNINLAVVVSERT
jgi:hypothetical protein